MIAFVNGRFVPEEQAVVSVFDRGFLYGDGLFETMRVSRGRLLRAGAHWARLSAGAALLHLAVPLSEAECLQHAQGLIKQNNFGEGVLRLVITRGIGPRGYSIRKADEPAVVMSLHPGPALDPSQLTQWRLATSGIRLFSRSLLSQHKTCNRLLQIAARAEAEQRGADEALLLNERGFVVEAASSNIFWVESGSVCTPPLASGGLAGITRAAVLEMCGRLGIKRTEKEVDTATLQKAEGVFLTLSSLGMVEAFSLDERPLARSALTRRLFAEYCAVSAQLS